MTKYYPKEHDIFKLCDRYKDSKIHYCPDCIDNESLLNQLKQVEGFSALKHHCIFRYNSKEHCCNSQELYPITKEDLFLAIADVKASVISRKLNIGFQRGKKHQITWETYRVWLNKQINECKGKPPNDVTVLNQVIKSKSLSLVFTNREGQVKKRSEDAWKCPFASLMTHSELTEKWFNFFIKNNDYFNIPQSIESMSDALKISSAIQGSTSMKNYKEGLPIYFIRLKLFANQSLSRIADTEIINKIPEIISSVTAHFKKSQELYTLYDEIIFVIADPQQDVKKYIEENLQQIESFTTNYYFEGSFSAKTKLISKELLVGYDNIFKEFQYTFYPKLNEKIAPKFAELGEDNVEAYHAKLCELCNMAEAVKTFWKFNDEEQKIHECLCEKCFKIRDRQKKINEAIQQGEEFPDSVGYKVAKWEHGRPDSKVCFIKIDLNLSLLSEILKTGLIQEFPLKTPTDKYNDENIGFSIIYEFLNHYREFLASFKNDVFQLEKFNKDVVDEKTKVSNEFEILDNFICLRFDEISEARDIMSIFVDTYLKFFPQFTGLHDSRNRDQFLITFSATISNIKFPFFEAWRYLNKDKQHFLNILAVRKFELAMDYREYHHLFMLDFKGKRISTFLHKLADIEARADSTLLLNTEIYNSKNEMVEIFQGVIKNHFYVKQLINFYKLTRDYKGA